MIIRELKKEDQDFVVFLYKNEDEEQFRRQQEEIPNKFQEVTERKRLILIAEDNDKIVGSVQLKFLHSNPELANGKDIVHIESLIVAPEYRKQGIGKALMQRAEQEARKLNFSKTTMGIKHGPTYSFLLSFYQKLGYAVLREKEDGTATVLVKNL